MKKNILHYLLSILGLLVILIIVWIANIPQHKKIQVPVVLIGDSIFGMYREDASVSYFLAEETKDAVFNGAFGGSTMALINREEREAYYLDSFSFVKLSLAMMNGDFGVQQTVRTKDYPISHFADEVDEFDLIDLKSMNTLIMCYGMNDYMAGVPLENPEDPYDPYTFTGALRVGIANLRKSYPNLRIIVVSPTFCWFLNTTGDSDSNNYGGGNLEAYVNAEKLVAEELGLEFVDWYHGVYEHDSVEKWEMYTEDGMHPNMETRYWMAQYLAEKIKK